jgi:hypothetical protein
MCRSPVRAGVVEGIGFPLLPERIPRHVQSEILRKGDRYVRLKIKQISRRYVVCFVEIWKLWEQRVECLQAIVVQISIAADGVGLQAQARR